MIDFNNVFEKFKKNKKNKFEEKLLSHLGDFIKSRMVYVSSVYMNDFFNGNREISLDEYLSNMIQRRNQLVKDYESKELTDGMKAVILVADYYLEIKNLISSSDYQISDLFNLYEKSPERLYCRVSKYDLLKLLEFEPSGEVSFRPKGYDGMRNLESYWSVKYGIGYIKDFLPGETKKHKTFFKLFVDNYMFFDNSKEMKNKFEEYSIYRKKIDQQ